MEIHEMEKIYSDINMPNNDDCLIIPDIYKMKVEGGYIYWRDVMIIKAALSEDEVPIHFNTCGVFVPTQGNQDELQSAPHRCESTSHC